MATKPSRHHPVWVSRYLDKLCLTVEAPTTDYLSRLLRAHLSTIPYENLTKLIYFRDHAVNGWHIPPIETFVDSLYTHSAGGTCFTVNSALHALLTELGYHVDYIRFSDHMGLVAHLPEGVRYLDVGVTGPFFEPVDFTVEPRVTYCHSGIHIHRKGDGTDDYYFDHVVYDEVRIRWEFNPTEPRRFEDFADLIARNNRPGEAHFLTLLRCQIWQPALDRNVSLTNNSLTIRCEDGREEKTKLHTIDEIQHVLTHEFRLPHLPLQEAVDVLTSLGIDIFAPTE